MSQEKQRTLLLVDDEENIISSLKRLLRRDGYNILTATSGKAGLEVLEQHQIGVIMSDMRMPEMSGVEFLSKVKERFPGVVRIMLSGYSDLASITDSINKGEIYKFLTKPWEDDLMRTNIREAFEHTELGEENKRLAIELTNINKDLEARVAEKAREVEKNLQVVQISQSILENLPVGVLCIGDDGVIANANHMAHGLLMGDGRSLLGEHIEDVLHADVVELVNKVSNNETVDHKHLQLDNQVVIISRGILGGDNGPKGVLLVITPSLGSNS